MGVDRSTRVCQGTPSRTAEDGRLEAALRSLPRAQASPDFTERLLARTGAAGAPRRNLAMPAWGWLAAAAALLALWLGPRALEWGSGPRFDASRAASVTPVATPLDSEQVRRLLARRDELEQELLALRRLAAELPPVVGVEGPSADYLIDLGELAPAGSLGGAGAAVPASYRSRP
jgi:hypothetical protein